jgi:hypothetical protein
LGRQADERGSQYVVMGTLGIWLPQDFSTPLPNAGLQGPGEECRGLVSMHMRWPDMLVNVCCVVFRWIIAQVVLTGLIIKLQVLLCFLIQEPEISHLHHTEMLLFDSVIDNANSSGVVEMDVYWRGKVGFLGVEEEGT